MRDNNIWKVHAEANEKINKTIKVFYFDAFTAQALTLVRAVGDGLIVPINQQHDHRDQEEQKEHGRVRSHRPNT